MQGFAILMTNRAKSKTRTGIWTGEETDLHGFQLGGGGGGMCGSRHSRQDILRDITNGGPKKNQLGD